jgi:signal transduction histidine kinase
MNEYRIRVLVIDDDSIDRDMTRRTLAAIGLPRFAVTYAESLAQAIEQLSAAEFDVALLDLGLPDSYRTETLQRFREACGDELSVIVLTGLTDEQTSLEAIDQGAHDYLIKGDVTPDLLSRSIRYTLQRQQLAKQLKSTYYLLEQNNVRLSQLCNTAQEFVENISHEFRTPLTVIREFTSIIRDGLDGPVTSKQAEHLDKVLHRTDDLALMVDDMLDISKLGAGLLTAWRNECRTADLIENVMGLLKSRAASKNIVLSISVPENLPAVFCDEEKARRVITNLTVNAIKFAPEGGRVTVWARHDEAQSQIEIGVRDNGPGISPENVDVIFERFRQVDAGMNSSTKGFGLGLNIATELVGLNLGRLNVNSKLGAGSDFSFTLPLCEPRAVFTRFCDRLNTCGRTSTDVSLLTVDAELVDTKQAIAIDEFLQRSFRSGDLVMPAGTTRWIVAAGCTQSECAHLERRLSAEWTAFTRNCSQVQFPPLRIQHRETWRVDNQREQLTEAFAVMCGRDSEEVMPTSTVLVIDDDREVRQCLSVRLASAGFRVESACDGEEGIAAAHARPPDVIVLDVRMPKMDGLTALRELRACPATKHTPIIMLSASIQDQQIALRAGASFFVRKPYEAAEVLSAIKSAIGATVT